MIGIDPAASNGRPVESQINAGDPWYTMKYYRHLYTPQPLDQQHVRLAEFTIHDCSHSAHPDSDHFRPEILLACIKLTYLISHTAEVLEM